MAVTCPCVLLCKAWPAVLLIPRRFPTPWRLQHPTSSELSQVDWRLLKPLWPLLQWFDIRLLQGGQCHSSVWAGQDLNNTTIILLHYPKMPTCRKKVLNDPISVPWTRKTTHYQNLRGCRLTSLSWCSLSHCLPSDLPGIFTRDIFAASLQNPK